MRVRLFHQIFLLVAVTALISAFGMAAVLSFNLNRGFTDYLQSRDVEQMDDFVAQIQTVVEAGNGAAGKLSAPISLRDVFVGMVRRGEVAGLPADFSFQLNDRRKGPAAGRPARPKRTGPPPSFGRRLLLFDVSGKQVLGPPPPPADFEGDLISRRLKLNGKEIGVALLLPIGPNPSNVDARFLRGQYVGAATLALLLLLLAIVPALLLARVGVRRFREMQVATDAISKGDFSVRLTPSGKDELAAMAQNINLMVISLEELEGTRKRWLAEVGHELRTPITIMRGELDAMQDGIRPVNDAALQSLSEEVGRLNLLIEDFHLLSVSELTDKNYVFSEIDLGSLVLSAEERFIGQMGKSGLDFTVTLDRSLPLMPHWDRARIEQFLGNLLTNSRRYTDEPGEVRLAVARKSEEIEICVEDSAPGVPPEYIESLFEPLFRLEESRSRASGGSGLGLAVCKAIVIAHGGNIEASASTLGGLRICAKLPLAPVKQ